MFTVFLIYRLGEKQIISDGAAAPIRFLGFGFVPDHLLWNAPSHELRTGFVFFGAAIIIGMSTGERLCYSFEGFMRVNKSLGAGCIWTIFNFLLLLSPQLYVWQFN